MSKINEVFKKNVKFFELVVEKKISFLIKGFNSDESKTLSLFEENLEKLKKLKESSKTCKLSYFKAHETFWEERRKYLNLEQEGLKQKYKDASEQKEIASKKYFKAFKKYRKNWDVVSSLYKENLDRYNKEKKNFFEEIVLLYEVTTAKLIEDFNFFGESEHLDLKLNSKVCVEYSFERNKFKEFYYDYVLHNINKDHKKTLDGHFYLLKENRCLKKKLSDRDVVIIQKFLMLMMKTNNKCLTDKKLKNLSGDLNRFGSDVKYFQYIINTLTLFFLLKDKTVFFNEFVVEIFEDFITFNLNYKLKIEKEHYEELFNLGLICYEIYSCYLIDNEDYFSNKFLKFLRNFEVWNFIEFWEEFFDYLKKVFTSDSKILYFTDVNKKGKKKKKVKNMFDILQIITCIGFYLLKLPFEKLFNILNQLNEKRKIVSPNIIYEFSKNLEKKILKNYSLKNESTKKNLNSNKESKLLITIKKSFDYLCGSDKTALNLICLNKNYNKCLQHKFLKHILKTENLERTFRLQIWRKIILWERSKKAAPIEKLPQTQLDAKILHVLNMDVKRTNFVKKNKERLLEMLTRVTMKFPSTSYYQGMNCIGGFFLNYMDEFEESVETFEFIVKKRLDRYLFNNFASLKKLFFIAEKLLEKFLPNLHKRLKELDIGNEYFISPIILTIFCSGLQFIENYTLEAIIMDIFIIDGWVGFFKVFIHILTLFEKKLLDMEYDVILEFLNKNIYEKLFYVNLKNFKSNCLKININKNNVFRLENEYDKTRKILDDYWTNYYDEKNNKNTKNGQNGQNGIH